ncbi:hypothetical protein OSB04_008694 [Centaurea solstitialis]|uniref:V-type proton ATPase subunit S1/VOA1 transmembrane domain-containing protein n=1 Tax=Centaurea solstitialis TaxID=347529 RepID=A0AA38TMD1_9ASTR|nr:hypothetical protein OSB04_008694 [Centaurea solstitialis]
MRMIAAAFVAVLLVVSALPLGLTFSSTAPAFLWTNTQDELTTNKVKEAVSYQTLSPKDLAKSVMSEGGWSNLLCPSQKPEDSVDLAIVFVGRESLDISGRKREDQALLDLLKASFTKSTFSLAYPYVSASEDDEALQKSLVSEFAETCGNDAALSNLGILESCAADGGNFNKLTDINSVNVIAAGSFNQILPYGVWFVSNRSPCTMTGVCSFKSGEEVQGADTTGQVFSELISSVEQTGAKYSVLYVSDPVNVLRYPSYRQLDRFLAQKSGNASDNSSCDGVCQIKSSLLEGLFVGLVLLIILISGLCCMAGIDTPTRFEAPQES